MLATKVYGTVGPGPNDRGLSRKHIIESCHGSLERLQTDHIDLYQAHRFDPDVPLEETLRAFDDLVCQGLVHYIGISEWTAPQIRAALDIAHDLGLHRIVSSQPQYSMLWRVPEAEVIPLCRKEGIGQVCWSPLAMGVLTGKYAPGREPPAGSRASTGSGITNRYLGADVLEAVQALRPIASEAGLSLAQLALAWVLQNDNVTAAIIGATRPEQVVENCAASGVSLEPDVLQKIDEALEAVVVTDPALTGD